MGKRAAATGRGRSSGPVIRAGSAAAQPTAAGSRAGGPRASRSGASRSGRGQARRRIVPVLVLGVLVGALSLGGGAALAHWRGGSVTAAAGSGAPRVEPLKSPEASPEPDPEASASASPSGASSPRPTVSASPRTSPSAGKPPTVPASGAGTFTVARSAGAAAGSGTLRRYKVEVEDGIDLSARQAAAEIEGILAHPRGWAAHGRGRFQLVSSNADFVIRIATPATADRLCLAQGLNTRGELNCETTDGVVVNLRRWLLGSPTFAGPPADYRHLIINHEIGHEIGIRQHLGCPGSGRPAPVMMQQIKGLNGCRSNAWPYDENGTYLTGPPA